MHRDIKLDNIFVKSKRTLVQGKLDSHDYKIEHYEFKIGDFGLATRCRAQDEFHVTFCGTPLHMAPEVLQRNQSNPMFKTCTSFNYQPGMKNDGKVSPLTQ